MKNLFAIVAVLSLTAASSPLLAGVVITQDIVTNSGPTSGTENRTIMVQGNKQKVVMRGQTVVLDLDKGKMLVLNASSKTYTELPFPPQGPMASMMQNMGGLNLDFKKTGGTRTLLGYQCQEYDSTGKSMMAEFSAKGCFSADAPGAEQYTAFTRLLAKKFASAGMAKTSGNPEGVPLVLETTTKFVNFNIPGMPPEQAENLKQMMANRPPTTSKSTTTSIKTADLSASTFEVPAGYTEHKIAMGRPMGMGGGMGMGGAHAPMSRPTPYEGE